MGVLPIQDDGDSLVMEKVGIECFYGKKLPSRVNAASSFVELHVGHELTVQG